MAKAQAVGARLKADPIRTDGNLTDTGVIKLDGLWRRAAQAHETPLQFSFQWKQAQVGQVSALITGADQGWRGGLTRSDNRAGPIHSLTESCERTSNLYSTRFRIRKLLQSYRSL